MSLKAVGDLWLDDGFGDLSSGLDHVLYDYDTTKNDIIVRIGYHVQQALIPLDTLKIEKDIFNIWQRHLRWNLSYHFCFILILYLLTSKTLAQIFLLLDVSMAKAPAAALTISESSSSPQSKTTYFTWKWKVLVNIKM